MYFLLIKTVNFLLSFEIRNNITEKVGDKSYQAKAVFEDNVKKMVFAKDTPDWIINMLYPVYKVGKSLLVPVFILLALAGAALIISLSVKYAKSENADEKDNAKKRLIWACIGVLIMLVALVIILIFINNSFAITQWIYGESEVGGVDTSSSSDAGTSGGGGGSGATSGSTTPSSTADATTTV